MKVGANPVPGEGSLSGLQTASYLLLHPPMAFPSSVHGRKLMSLPLLVRTQPTRLKPHLFNLNYFPKGLISKYRHTWAKTSTNENREEHNSVHGCLKSL